MARDVTARFAGPSGKILNMLVFLTGVGAVAFYMSPLYNSENTLLIDSFNANKGLNGLILLVLFMGIVYNLRQAAVVGPAADWIRNYASQRGKNWRDLPRPPGLIRAVSSILSQSDRKGGVINRPSATAILDSVGTRVDEGREFGKYIANLLVFLGLLGTFWGLLETVTAVGDTIKGLAATSTGGSTENAVAELINNLQKPLGGMGTAFSSSLFGLGGSLIVGYLDIQAGQAQNRFYSDLEDWLSGVTQVGGVPGGGEASAFTGGDDVLGSLNNIELALNKLAAAQNVSQSRAAEEVRAEIRQLGTTLTGRKSPSSTSPRRKGQ